MTNASVSEMSDEIPGPKATKGPRFKAVEIKSFRGLHDVRLDGLSRVNIIAGKNNAGKTSVLEALAACCHPVDGKAWIDMVLRRGSRLPLDQQIRQLFPSDPEGMPVRNIELSYERSGSPPQWRIEARLAERQELASEIPDEELTLANAIRTVTQIGLYLEPVGAAANSALRAQVEFSLRPGKTVPNARSVEDISTVSVTSQTHRAEGFQIALLASLDERAARDSILTLLRQFDADVEDVEVYDPSSIRSAIRIWHKQTGPTPISAFGDGFRRVLTYALALYRCRDGGVLLIDEIETAIHYSALRDAYAWLVRSCEAYDVQLFVTTHSLEAIDALLDATPEKLDTTYFRLEARDRQTRVIRFDEEDLRALRDEFGDEVR
ncbi:MAG TPA: AAA family ATPase [Polyangium sp.]|nr:AAA family ATPase [Polyangium sp.]